MTNAADAPRARLRADSAHPDLVTVHRRFGTAALLLFGLSLALGDGVGERLAESLLGLAYGLAWWSFLEYLLHRFVLHWEPEGPRARALRRRLPGHRGHHNTPADADQIVSTRHAFALPLAVPLFLGMLVIGFSVHFAVAALAGGALGYAAYETVHFGCHRGRASGWYWRMIRHHHAIHHHRDETVNFGVTSPLWDMLFRTRYRPAARRRPA
ncbi:sterol desaturase family protein [Oceanicella sp. SM1341]|uniref:sterol desaturase family protein n=1 Tax=Oceanicella sp. SM1341 TaxID=1548889 RepID=UPI000E46E562|nr:sterol desaturase family protein [Oceanicella sp. SM1341]